MNEERKLEAIENLRSDLNYYGPYGRQFLSNSDIGTLLYNPKLYGQSRPDSKNLAEGRYFHQLLLEPEKAKDVHFVDATTRNTNKYREYCEAHNVEFVLLKNEVEKVEAMVSAMRSNIQFYDDIYAAGNLYEEPAVVELEGMIWKGKADIVGRDFVIDLKTTSDIHKFPRAAKSYNYDSQAYLYQQMFGKPLVFYVVDKETHQLGIFHTTEDFITGGLTKVRKAVDVYTRFFGENASEAVQNHFIEGFLT